MRALLALLILPALPIASAVYLNQILYDPVGSESGGEAIEIRSDVSADLSGWVIATPKSKSEFIFPNGTAIAPGQSILIADVNWSIKRDNPAWRPADFEEALTLPESGWIELYNAQGKLVDFVTWESFTAEEGKALLRIAFTGNVSADWAITEPSFYSSSLAIALEAIAAEARIEGDASSEPGIQLRPGQIFWIIGYSPNATLLTLPWQNLSLQQGNFSIELKVPERFPPGNHTARLGGIELRFEIVAMRAFELSTTAIRLSAARGGEASTALQIRNTGNVDIRLRLIATSLAGPVAIPPSAISWDCSGQTGNFSSGLELQLGVGSSLELKLSLRLPQEIPAGKYFGQLGIDIVEDSEV